MQRLRWAALAALLVQSLLLFSNLGLLPLWGDEYFTLQTIKQPLPEMFETLRRDIHPPLYFLAARYWSEVPWTGDAVIRLRLLSSIVTLAASALAMWLFIPRLNTRGAMWFCALLAVSPCLILYGRMARSYSLQVLVVLLAVDQLLRLLREPTHTRSVAVGITAALVLYTHYAPGIAVVAAINLAVILRYRRVLPLLLPNAAMLAAYAPWLVSLAMAVSTWRAKIDLYRVTGGSISSEIVKLGYWAVSFLFGENIPWWLLLAEIPLTAGLLWVAWLGRSRAREWGLPVAILALVAYAGVSRWVSYPFLPARLLFLLPFVLLLLAQGAEIKPIAGRILLGATMVTSVIGLGSYFTGQNFLNWGYAVPYPQIAREIASDRPTAVVGLLTDSSALSYYLPSNVPYHAVEGTTEPERVAAEFDAGRRVCVVRQTHASSSQDFYRRFDQALAAKFPVRTQHLYLPRTPLDQFMIRALGWTDTPPYFYEMIEFSRD